MECVDLMYHPIDRDYASHRTVHLYRRHHRRRPLRLRRHARHHRRFRTNRGCVYFAIVSLLTLRPLPMSTTLTQPLSFVFFACDFSHFRS